MVFIINKNSKSISNYFKLLWVFKFRKKVTKERPTCLTIVHFTEFTSRNLTAVAVHTQKNLCKAHLILPNKKYVILLTGYQETLLPMVTDMGKVLDLDVHYNSAQTRELLHRA